MILVKVNESAEAYLLTPTLTLARRRYCRRRSAPLSWCR